MLPDTDPDTDPDPDPELTSNLQHKATPTIDAYAYCLVPRERVALPVWAWVLAQTSQGPTNLCPRLEVPRAATVTAMEDSVVWVIDRYHFKDILMKAPAPFSHSHCFLAGVPLTTHSAVTVR